MVKVVISVATEETVQSLVDSIATQLGYIWNYKNNFNLHNLHSLAFEVAKRCGGLPNAIATIAKALKDKQEHEWKNALRELKRLSSESLVGLINEETIEIIDDYYRANMLFFKNMFPDLKKRYQHSKKASVKAMEVSELEKEGKFDKI
ncbi:hypothetical protein Ddye_031621 [Dipteronia dyeriana]|uniref:NB-ARC domain-containing protein n=1 Tax=Dipteronia dyeriana TaxID=168575 RepID=A0AAD9TJP0_9ROSI|nr:hypothetical protein Ddye_031621 [Dipteronia dyeriana]